jgi:NADPH:quinone reductase-like Zn-dependent oxidoreductase
MPTPAMMHAVRLRQYGGPEQLGYDADVPVPAPGPGQLLIRSRATSINPWDLKLASGAFRDNIPMSLPYVPGSDVAGTVASVGPGAAGFAVGQAVFAHAPIGAYAEFVVAPAGTTAAKPARLSDTDAAAVPLAGQTAWQALFEDGRLAAGETVHNHAAAGGVGTFAVQFAHARGARVYATASADNAEFVRGLGADVAIDYRAQRFEDVAKDVDLVLDLLGGETQARSLAVLKPGGRLVSTVQPPPADQAARRNVRAMMMQMKPIAARLAEIGRLIDAGTVRPVVSQVLPLERAAEGWTLSRSGHTRGKIVLAVSA